MNKFRWCFIGAGSLAKTVAFQLNRSGRHEIVSCYTRNYEKGIEFAKKYGGRRGCGRHTFFPRFHILNVKHLNT